MTHSPSLTVPMAAVLALGIVGCGSDPTLPENAVAEPAAAALDPRRDHHSRSDPKAWRTTHLDLDLAVDFERKVLAGHVTLELARGDGGELVLDTRDLDIQRVKAGRGDDWSRVEFTLDPADPVLGRALRIRVPEESERVRIHYATSPQASGLQWLTPAQTAGKKRSYLYSQSQAIHARSWIPLQDTPQVRATYSARLRTPRDLFAVMSAKNQPEARRDGDYHFTMAQPVPSYLIAIAVGDIRFRATGPRTGIYGERGILRAAAAEFEDTEAMMRAAEHLWGPYRWERYDLLVLPPSFPYGGMENPRLTFLTPTSVAGDKSGVALIAHELAHSWSGNLVTNASWRDFWLNEGTTTYLTWRLMEAVYGKPRADMERVLGLQSLQRSVSLAKRPGDRALAVDQRGRDPDALFSSIPYVRGALFFEDLEAAFGREAFDAFLRGWFDANAFESRTTEDFLQHLDNELQSDDPEVYPMARVRTWVHEPDLPAGAALPTSDAFNRVDAERAAWLSGAKPAAALPGQRWSVLEWRHFLATMPDTVTTAKLAELDTAFHLTDAKNAFVLRDWFQQAIRHGHRPAFGALEAYLRSVGRTTLIERLYRELARTPAGRADALRIYSESRPLYHPITRAEIERVLAAVAPGG